MLSGFDRVGAHARDVHAFGLGVPGDDRLQLRGAQFHRLLHHVVMARAFERREQIVQIARTLLRPRLLVHGEHCAALSCTLQLGSPFPVAAVENKQLVAWLVA